MDHFFRDRRRNRPLDRVARERDGRHRGGHPASNPHEPTVDSVQAGTAVMPLSITGKVFLSGPTAQVTAVSDPIPDVFGGAQLSIRSVALDLSMSEFTLNPTSCEKLANTAILSGGGGSPVASGSWSTFTTSAAFETSNCGALKSRPKLITLYLVPSNHTLLPDLLADLKGQVEIQLRGVIRSVQGGKKGLIQNSRNLCAHTYFSKLNFLSQNGKHLLKKKLPLGVAGCHGVKAPKKGHK